MPLTLRMGVGDVRRRQGYANLAASQNDKACTVAESTTVHAHDALNYQGLPNSA